jgi:hypothetical protein
MTMKAHYIFILLLIVACTKLDNQTNIELSVVDSYSGEVVPNMALQLTQKSEMIPNSGRIFETFTTDENGKFVLSELPRKTVQIGTDYLGGNLKNIIEWIENDQIVGKEIVEVKRKQNRKLIAKVLFKSLLKIQYNNINCVGYQELIEYQYKYELDENFTQYKFAFAGCDTYEDEFHLPYGEYLLRFRSTRLDSNLNEQITFFDASVTLNKNEPANLEVNY